MKKFLAPLIASLSLVALHASAQDSDDAIVLGKKLTIESKVLAEERSLLVWTPASYDSEEESYPVLYLLDGDSHFHHTTGVVDFLATNGRIPELIVVAIPNTDRTRDLTPASTAKGDIEQMPTQGGADNFLSFLSDELIPFIEGNYRTRPHRILVGHSFGGLFAIHALTTRPEIFNAYIAISPSLQWSDQGLVAQAEAFFTETKELKADLYMTVGNEGGTLLGGVRKVSGILDAKSPQRFRWGFRLMEEESHGSVPHRSTYQGLEAVFRGWHLPDAVAAYDQGGLEAIDRHYANSGKRYGYERTTPPSTLFELGFLLIQANRLDDADAVLFGSDNPPPAVLLDMLAVKNIEVENTERAKELYIESIKLNPGNPVTRAKLEEMGVDVDALLPKIEITAETLASYVGKYQVTPALVITVSLDGTQLTAEAPGLPSVELTPLSPTRFSTNVSEIVLEFEPDSAGKVDRLTVHQAGQESSAKRIE